MPMRKKSLFASVFYQAVRGVLCACAGLVLAVSSGQGAVNVSFSSSGATLQDEFIANATSQYLGTLTKSPWFSNTYSLVVTGINPGYQPPVVSSPILTGSAFQECIALGVGLGMDYERYANIQQTWGIQAQEALGNTCGGIPVSVLTSTAAVLGACVQAYNVVTSTISQRWGYVYDMYGNIVAP